MSGVDTEQRIFFHLEEVTFKWDMSYFCLFIYFMCHYSNNFKASPLTVILNLFKISVLKSFIPFIFFWFDGYPNIPIFFQLLYDGDIYIPVQILSVWPKIFLLQIYIIIIIIIMSCRQHGYPWPSLATSPYHSSPPAGLQGYILCPHIVAVCKIVLVVLLLHIHTWGSIGIHRLWARPCFSSSVPRVWFV